MKSGGFIEESEEMIKMHPLTEDNCSFSSNEDGTLRLSYQGNNYDKVEILETFPFSAPHDFLSVRNLEDKSKEIGYIENLEKDFPHSSCIIDHLKLRYHMPVIQKFLSTKESNGYTEFVAETNMGETSFSLRVNRSYITDLGKNRLIIQDVNGNRFEIPDKKKLSSKDLKKLDVFM